MIWKVSGLTVLTVFYGCYLGKMIVQRRKGIVTDQMGKGKVGFVKAIEVTMKFSAYLAFIAAIISICLGTTALPIGVRILGILLSAAGTAIFIAAVLTMRDQWRAGVSLTDRTELVTNGIYRFSRNPAFLGFDLLYLGILLMFFNWALLAASALAALLYHLQIVNVEEDYLLSAFGDEYLAYKKRVCRYLGRRKARQ